MGQSNRFKLVTAAAPIAAAVTKFGGQPHWVAAPQWPLSRLTEKPMQFIAQIRLDPPLFAGVGGRMAYLFMSGDDEYVDSTWEPDGGENALVIQPGLYDGPSAPLRAGPSLYRLVEQPGQSHYEREPVEFGIESHLVQEPDYQPRDERAEWTAQATEAYVRGLSGNKIGGAPLFLQGDEFPPGATWRLVMQLDSAAVPFFVNFGDAGVGYAFIDESERLGRFLWQSL